MCNQIITISTNNYIQQKKKKTNNYFAKEKWLIYQNYC